MADRSFRSTDGRFGLRLPAREWDRIRQYCRESGDLETGGILLGAYNEALDTAIVSAITGAPRDSRRGRSWFERGVDGLQRLIDRLWTRERRYYLGEWHFHPDGPAGPSTTDLDQMRLVAASPAYQCPEPLLLIVAGWPDGDWRVHVSVHVGERYTPLQETVTNAS